MKKILSLILFALLFLPLEGQGILRASPFYLSPISYPDFCAEYDTVFDAMTTKPSVTVAIAQNALVDSLDQNGYWARMDYLLVPATEVNTGGEALINWITPGTYDADNVHATAWTTLEGYTGDGANGYISSNFNLSANSTNYTLNSASVGIYLRINQIEDNANVFGAYYYVDGSRTSYRVRNSSNVGIGYVNKYNGLPTGFAGTTNSSGLFILTRTAADAIGCYYNGSLLDDIETDASDAIPNVEIYILDCAGTTNLRSTNQFSIFFLMDGIDSTDAAALNTIFERYMDAIGKGVQ